MNSADKKAGLTALMVGRYRSLSKGEQAQTLVGLVLVATVLIAGFFALYLKFFTSYRPSESGPQQRGPYATDACSNARFIPCFITSNGQFCRDEIGSPLGTLIANGSYTIIEQDIDANGKCVLTLQLSGTVDGSSYNRTVRVWGNK